MTSDEEYLEQTRLLRDQLKALDAGPRARWRRFRRLEWVCAGCGETIVEVLQLHPWRVVRARRDLSSRRAGAWSFTPLPDVRPHEAGQTLLPALCRCQNREGMTQALLWDDLETGRRKRSLPADRDPGYSAARRS